MDGSRDVGSYVRLSLWFGVASLLQLTVVSAARDLGLSALTPNLTPGKLAVLVVVGQIAGYLFLAWYQGRPEIAGVTHGFTYGLILWILLGVFVAPRVGFIRSPLALGSGAVLASIAAFLIYGAVVGFAVEREVRRAPPPSLL